jgi:hypothetical protein
LQLVNIGFSHQTTARKLVSKLAPALVNIGFSHQTTARDNCGDIQNNKTGLNIKPPESSGAR